MFTGVARMADIFMAGSLSANLGRVEKIRNHL
jgi:hypothetical protein